MGNKQSGRVTQIVYLDGKKHPVGEIPGRLSDPNMHQGSDPRMHRGLAAGLKQFGMDKQGDAMPASKDTDMDGVYAIFQGMNQAYDGLESALTGQMPPIRHVKPLSEIMIKNPRRGGADLKMSVVEPAWEHPRSMPMIYYCRGGGLSVQTDASANVVYNRQKLASLGSVCASCDVTNAGRSAAGVVTNAYDAMEELYE